MQDAGTTVPVEQTEQALHAERRRADPRASEG
jgi:hypothetical protein